MIKLLAGNGKELNFRQTMFPVGENYVQLDPASCEYICAFVEPKHSLIIKWVFNGDSEIVQLLLLVNAVRNLNPNLPIFLDIPYFPGARQDRVCEFGEGFGCKVYAEIINAQNFAGVTIFDPHSDVCTALLNKAKGISNRDFVNAAITDYFANRVPFEKNKQEREVVLISPDAGANKKIFKLAQKLSWNRIEVLRADKVRDTKSGKIVETVLYATDEQVKGKVCFVVDDICSRGGTFMELAKLLKAKGAGKVILIVSHYEGTADAHKLKDSGIDKVYTYNDFGNTSPTDTFVTKLWR